MSKSLRPIFPKLGIGSPVARSEDAPFHRQFQWRWEDTLPLYVLIISWVLAVMLLPNGLWHPATQQATILIGGIGIWRYSWWLINLSRGTYYGKVRYPAMRRHADAVWDAGWRPNHIHFMMTTYHERKPTTELYLKAIVSELQRDNLRGTLWVGLGAKEDEEVISEWMDKINYPNLDVVLLRQNQPGKRVAIGIILRALSRRGVHPDDIAFLMDGDSILDKGVLRKCVSLFGAFPDLKALTTDEDAVCEGPLWVQRWLTMRFAQRRMWMQSHAMSGRVLTLTGRMSGYRATSFVNKEFIRTVESDHLNHWLWGSFRFLSGDDKSTWYCMLKDSSRMMYVPDAMVYTIEYIEGNGVIRMRDNLLRWSGNMLRNGTRAIMLGPKRVTPFIWWCLIDQRISIWTVLMGMTAAFSITVFSEPSFFLTYLLWIIFTRFMMSVALFCYSDRIYISYPFTLYANQMVSALLKVYIMFRLPQQRWTNRLNQKGGEDVMNNKGRRLLALYMNIFYLACMFLLVLLLTGILELPNMMQLKVLFF